jgi:hypothetical protein
MWHKAKKAKSLSKTFWEGQRESLEDFDKKNLMAFQALAPMTTSATQRITPGKIKPREEPAKLPLVQQPLAPTQKDVALTSRS